MFSQHGTIDSQRWLSGFLGVDLESRFDPLGGVEIVRAVGHTASARAGKGLLADAVSDSKRLAQRLRLAS